MAKLKALKKFIVPATMVTAILISSGATSERALAETNQNYKSETSQQLIIAPSKEFESVIKNDLKRKLELNENGKEVSILIKGEKHVVKTSSNLVKEIITESGIVLSKNDETYPSLDSELKDGEEILIITIEEEEYDKIKKLPFNVIEEFSAELPYGERKVVQKGEKGEKKFSFKQEKKNGIIISEEKYSEKTIKAPVDEKVIIGTKEVVYETIDFTTETRSNHNLYKGESKVIQEGVNGKKELIYNNNGSDRVLVSSDVSKEATTKIIEVGTKEKPVAIQSAKSSHKYSLADFKFRGVVHDNGRKFTYYSQSVLPGGGLKIPGRHVNSGGYVADSNGYIVIAANRSIPKGTVISTPFGYQGKVYDICASCDSRWFDVYIK